MARITPQQRQRYGLLAGLVPAEVLAAIDDRELGDRLAQASGLMQQVAKAATPGAGRQFGDEARRILAARPRAVTEQLVMSKIAKARLLGSSSPQAADLERQAREELLRHPPAVRRAAAAQAVAKAKAAKDQPPVPVFDGDGNLIGVVDPSKIIPVAGAGKTRTGTAQPAQQQAQPAPAAAPAAAADQQVIKSLGPAWLGVHNFSGTLCGAVRRADVTAAPAGRVAKSMAPSTRHANIYNASRKLVGQAPLTAIVSLADLRARAGRRR